MVFPSTRAKIGRNDDVLSLLSMNEKSAAGYKHTHRQASPPPSSPVVYVGGEDF